MESVIYVGQSVGGVMRNQLFVSRPLKTIARLEKDYPLIGALFVNMSDYADAEADLKMTESLIYRANEQVKGGKKHG